SRPTSPAGGGKGRGSAPRQEQGAPRNRSGPPSRAPGKRTAPAAPPTLARTGRELLYGRNAVAEALRGRRPVDRLFLAEGVREDDRLRAIVAAAEARRASIERVPRLLLDDALPGAHHQGVALEAEPFPYVELSDLIAAPGVVLVLDHMQDPQNFGTLLRAAEAAGAAGVVIPQDRAVAVSPAVVNASAGAVEHLRIALVPNLPRAIEQLKGAGRWAIGLDAVPGAVDLLAADLPTPAALVVGGEGAGISHAVRNACDLFAALPMRGQVASLNAATAGAIALYELLRREQAATGGEVIQ
ncbi:MAG TPA: 23S rRNA (guanosine(2251)-2'-O)-methyltransferase RlmB, partial [Thermomicrobiales bacterium]|nr:23S rRNA (guanosine(2251)-2'-O)-methyltransferase RlmB [Thermomicrobiales bacterium]